MNKSTLEKMTASMVVMLTTLLALGFILMAANGIFQWDLFPPFTEKIIYFVALSMLVVVLAATLVNVMLNMSRLAHFSEVIARQILEQHEK